MVKRAQIVEAARELAEHRYWLQGKEYVGVRYRHEGRDLHGMDCCGVPIWIALLLALPTKTDLSKIRGYGKDPQPGFVKHYIDAGCTFVPHAAALPGHMGIFRSDAWPFHCGIIGEKNGQRTLIHALLPRRRVMEEPFRDLIVNQWTHTLRFPGVED